MQGYVRLFWSVGLACLLMVVALSAAGAPATAGSAQWRWVMTDLGTLGGDYSAAVAVNDLGQVVGTSRTANGERHVFLWANGRMTDLGRIKGEVVLPNVLLNNRGQVVWSQYGRNAIMWQHDAVKALGLKADAINDRGQVVGWRRTSGRSQAVMWDNGRIRDLGTGDAVAINNRGQVIVNSGSKALLWQNAKTSDLGTLGGEFSEACAINERGQIIGIATRSRTDTSTASSGTAG